MALRLRARTQRDRVAVGVLGRQHILPGRERIEPFLVEQIMDRHRTEPVVAGDVGDVEQVFGDDVGFVIGRSEEHTSELQSLMRISYAVFCLKKKKKEYE